MSIKVKVPALPESVADATLAKWYKQAGDAVTMGEPLVDLETDKVMLEVPAPESGVLGHLLKPEGSTVLADEVLTVIEQGQAAVNKASVAAEPVAKASSVESADTGTQASEFAEPVGPAVRRLLSEHTVEASAVRGTGKDGRLLKSDVEQHLKGQDRQHSALPTVTPTPVQGERLQQRVPMTRLRQRIAERLVHAQQTTAMLTTFNEVNMQPVMDLRSKYKDLFEKKHDVRLGFMSLFVKAAVAALQRFPEINASVDGTDIVYHGFFDVGIAVSSPRGLVVPVLRDVDQQSLAAIEKEIRAYSDKAQKGRLSMEEMTGGTFTITNGGVFGSMLSTPILNPPQSAILGMHNIVKRPVVENDQIVIRPVMYLALSYDHRIVDGAQSVQFLVAIKQMLEDPARLLLDV